MVYFIKVWLGNCLAFDLEKISIYFLYFEGSGEVVEIFIKKIINIGIGIGIIVLFFDLFREYQYKGVILFKVWGDIIIFDHLNNIIVITVSPDSRIPIHDRIGSLKL